jgi:hypothetical protein
MLRSASDMAGLFEYATWVKENGYEIWYIECEESM